MLIQQMCPVLLGAVLVFPAFFPHCCIYGSMSVCTLVYRWRLLTGLCKVDAPSTLHTSILCEGDALKKKKHNYATNWIFTVNFIIIFIYQQ